MSPSEIESHGALGRLKQGLDLNYGHGPFPYGIPKEVPVRLGRGTGPWPLPVRVDRVGI